MPTCSICNDNIAAPRRKYCGRTTCARKALRQWKQAVYARAIVVYHEGLKVGERGMVRPRLDGWLDDQGRKAYFREYMRGWRRRRRQLAIASLLSTLTLAGCEAPVAAVRPVAVTDAVCHAANARPVKIVLLEDQTGSRTTTRTEQVTHDVLDPLIALLKETCGQLLVGAIRDSSNRPLIRLIIEAAPPRPVARPLPPNAFDALEVQALNNKDLSAYELVNGEWRRKVDASVAEFLRKVKELTSEPTLATRSAVADAIARADAAASEPEIVSTEGRRYIVLASDAADTTRKTIAPIRSDAVLVVANGSGTLGSAAAVPGVKRFEKLAAALSWVSESLRRMPSTAR